MSTPTERAKMLKQQVQGSTECNVADLTNNLPPDSNEPDAIDAPPVVPDLNEAMPADLMSAVALACNDTEAHPMAVALHFLTYFAAHIGQQRFIRIGNNRQPLAVYGLLAGKTGKVKGTARAQVVPVFDLATQKLIEEYEYKPPRIVTGLSSGEGLINLLQDPSEAIEGTTDKRLLIEQTEFSEVMSQNQRKGNILTDTLRDAYDGEMLSTLTLQPRLATAPHACLIGHITPYQLTKHECFAMQSFNGSMNRFLIFYAHRKQYTPVPKTYTQEELENLTDWLASVIWKARQCMKADDYQNNMGQEMHLTPAAKEVLHDEYAGREKHEEMLPEPLASLLARQREHVWRIAALLALMDMDNDPNTIDEQHFTAAYHWVDYSRQSLRYLLRTANHEAQQGKAIALADRVFHAIQVTNSGQGCTTSEIHKHFNNHLKGSDLSKAIDVLLNEVPPRITCQKQNSAQLFRVIP